LIFLPKIFRENDVIGALLAKYSKKMFLREVLSEQERQG